MLLEGVEAMLPSLEEHQLLEQLVRLLEIQEGQAT
jgi:hypothetical protein